MLGYQLTNEDVLAALRTVRRHLKPGGLFVCDVWYGPAVLAQRPSDRVKVIPTAEGKVIRAASGTLDTYRHLCEVRYHLWRLRDGQVACETEESHQVRYFFPQELALLLAFSEMDLVDIRSFGTMGRPADGGVWSILAVARRLLAHE